MESFDILYGYGKRKQRTQKRGKETEEGQAEKIDRNPEEVVIDSTQNRDVMRKFFLFLNFEGKEIVMLRIAMLLLAVLALGAPVYASAGPIIGHGTKVDLLHDHPYEVALCPGEDATHHDGIYPCIYVQHGDEAYLTLIDKDGEFMQFEVHAVGNDLVYTFVWARDE